MTELQKAIFLDKDGTLMEDIPYNSDPDQFLFSAGVVDGLHLLKNHGFLFFLVSNQSGVARGKFPVSALKPMEERMRSMFSEHGLDLVDVAWCPHLPGGTVPAFAIECDCRKPRPGMLLSLAAKHGIHLSKSWMIGDKPSDVEAGQAAGCHTAFLSGVNCPDMNPPPTRIAPNFLDLARSIVAFPSPGSF